MQGKRYLVPVFVLLFLIGVPVEGYCGFESGNNLVKYMREYEKAHSDSTRDYQESAFYMGYVTAVSDTLWRLNFDLVEIPEEATIGQICSVVSKFLKENPDRWHEAGVNLVIDALRAAFPKKR